MRDSEKQEKTLKQLKAIKALHKLVIHQKSGTNRQYFLETKKIDEVPDSQLSFVCWQCFG